MKKWYAFYNEYLIKMQQVAAELGGAKWQQPVAEIDLLNWHQLSAELEVSNRHQPSGELNFPDIFALVPWGHHIQVISKISCVVRGVSSQNSNTFRCFAVKRPLADYLRC